MKLSKKQFEEDIMEVLRSRKHSVMEFRTKIHNFWDFEPRFAMIFQEDIKNEIVPMLAKKYFGNVTPLWMTEITVYTPMREIYEKLLES